MLSATGASQEALVGYLVNVYTTETGWVKQFFLQACFAARLKDESKKQQ